MIRIVTSARLAAILRRMRGPLAACFGAIFLFPCALQAEPPPFSVIDLHVDLPYRSLYKGRPFAFGSGEYVADKLQKAGVSGVVLPLYLPKDASPQGRTRAELERSYAHVFRSILTTAPYSLFGCSIDRAGNEARSIETWLAFEGAEPVGSGLMEIRTWAMRGVRSFGLVHSEENALATSSGQATTAQFGLSEQGREFVQNVFQVGGLIDVSHASDQATDEALALAHKTGGIVIATHSNSRRLAPHPRNLTDQQIRGIAQAGGVIGVNFHQRFLSRDGGRDASLSDLVRQVKYLVQVAGPDAVAIGSDFEGGIRPVLQLSDATQYQKLARALLAAGLSAELVAKIFAQNARRVLCPRDATPLPRAG